MLSKLRVFIYLELFLLFFVLVTRFAMCTLGKKGGNRLPAPLLFIVVLLQTRLCFTYEHLETYLFACVCLLVEGAGYDTVILLSGCFLFILFILLKLVCCFFLSSPIFSPGFSIFFLSQVMTFEDLKELGDEEAVKKAGKLRQQGKKYVVQDADVIFFKVGLI